MKEDLREAKVKEPSKVLLGNRTFLLHPFGTSSGYPFLMSDEDFKVEFGESNSPSFFVTFKNQALWRESAYSLHQKFLDWAESVGFATLRPERLSRIDCCFDYHLPQVDFETDHFVTRFSKDAVYREDGKVQTFSFGRGDVVLRVYDKVAEIRQQSNKVWFYTLWEMDQDVWRIEWQVRKARPAAVRYRDLRGSEELPAGPSAVSGRGSHLLAGTGRGYEPVPVAPSSALGRSAGVGRANGPPWSMPDQRQGSGTGRAPDADGDQRVRVRQARAAIQCVKKNKEIIPLDEAFDSLRNRIATFHHPFNWGIDVKKRIESIEGGNGKGGNRFVQDAVARGRILVIG